MAKVNGLAFESDFQNIVFFYRLDRLYLVAENNGIVGMNIL